MFVDHDRERLLPGRGRTYSPFTYGQPSTLAFSFTSSRFVCFYWNTLGSLVRSNYSLIFHFLSSIYFNSILDFFLDPHSTV